MLDGKSNKCILRIFCFEIWQENMSKVLDKLTMLLALFGGFFMHTSTNEDVDSGYDILSRKEELLGHNTTN